MGPYRDRVVPRLIDLAGGARDLRPWRERACAGLAGTVVEVGFGSGHNVPFYPRDVTAVFAVEPSDRAWRLAARRVEGSPVPVTRVGLRGESVPLDDASCDAALITFTLCTVADPAVVLGEVARLLRPGGELHFLEHGRSTSERVARWQRRLDPLQQRLFDGCHLTRDPRGLVEASGMAVLWSESRPARGPQPWTYLTVGAARVAAPSK